MIVIKFGGLHILVSVIKLFFEQFFTYYSGTDIHLLFVLSC
jgi:hypothetical protein